MQRDRWQLFQLRDLLAKLISIGPSLDQNVADFDEVLRTVGDSLHQPLDLGDGVGTALFQAV